MLSTVLGFREGRVIIPFLRRRPQVFPRVGVIMNLKRFDVLLDNKLSVMRWYIFCFLLFFLRGKMTNTSTSSPRSFHIDRKKNGRRKCKLLYVEEGTVSTIAFCMNLAQLFILSYLTTPWKMFLSKKTLYTVLGQLLMNILILFIQLRDLFSNEKVTHYGMGGE